MTNLDVFARLFMAHFLHRAWQSVGACPPLCSWRLRHGLGPSELFRHSKTAQTGHLTQQTFFTSSRFQGWKPNIEVPENSVSGENYLSSLQTAPSNYVSTRPFLRYHGESAVRCHFFL